ncbi:MAG: C25 family cysteine peptidase [Arenicella sp.]
MFSTNVCTNNNNKIRQFVVFFLVVVAFLFNAPSLAMSADIIEIEQKIVELELAQRQIQESFAATLEKYSRKIENFQRQQKKAERKVAKVKKRLKKLEQQTDKFQQKIDDLIQLLELEKNAVELVSEQLSNEIDVLLEQKQQLELIESKPTQEQLIQAAVDRITTKTDYALTGRCQSNRPDRYALACFSSDREQLLRITHANLIAEGINLLGVPKESIGVLSKGLSVPVYVSADTLFDENSFIEVLVQGYDSIYTDDRSYQLFVSFQDPPNNLVGEVAGDSGQDNATEHARATLTIDDNRAYNISALTGEGWYNPDGLLFLSASQTQHLAFEFDLDVAAQTDIAAQLSYHFAKEAYYEQSVLTQIEINGIPVGSGHIDEPGTNSSVVTVSVPGGVLLTGMNTLTVTVSNQGARQTRFEFDQFSVNYQSSLEARHGELIFSGDASAYHADGFSSDSLVVYRQSLAGLQRLSNVAVLSSANGFEYVFDGAAQQADFYILQPVIDVSLVQPRAYIDINSGSAQYLIISHPDFVNSDALASLVALREGDYSVKKIDVEHIYAQYAYGTFDATAIKDYIRDMMTNSDTQMVLLVGDDTYDYQGRLNKGEQSWIPSLYLSSPLVAPSDALYVDNDNNGTPDIAIGRMPVSSAAELQNIVDKTWAYHDHIYSNRVLLATNYSDGLGVSIYHPALMRRFNDAGWRYYEAFVQTEGVAADVEQARQDVLYALNSGVSLMVYTGHNSSVGGPLFSAADIQTLSNVNKPTVAVMIDSFTGYYVSDIVSDSIGMDAESFLVAKDVGGAAAFAPASLIGFDAEQSYFLQQGIKNLTLGETYVYALRFSTGKTTLAYNLLGDPALRLKSVNVQ